MSDSTLLFFLFFGVFTIGWIAGILNARCMK